MLDRDTGEEELDGEGISKAMRVSPWNVCQLKKLTKSRCQLRTALSNFPTPLQKKYFSFTFGVASSAATTNSGSTALGYPVISVVWDDSVTGCPNEYIGKSVEAFERFALPEEMTKKDAEDEHDSRALC